MQRSNNNKVTRSFAFHDNVGIEGTYAIIARNEKN